jgi:hypothetical protein
MKPISPWTASPSHSCGKSDAVNSGTFWRFHAFYCATLLWNFTVMIALDDTALASRAIAGRFRVPRLRLTLGPLVGGIAVAAAVLVVGAILFRGFAENGFRLGSQLAWRYASLVFFAALVAGPVCRLTARFLPGLTPPESLGRKLVWGFCASYGVYLLSVFLPNVIRLSAGATLMVLFGGSVALVMALTAAPIKRLGDTPVIPAKFRRVLLGTAAGYFWLCYALMGLARVYGPNRPDAFYGISLCLMLTGLLVRFADRWFSQER